MIPESDMRKMRDIVLNSGLSKWDDLNRIIVDSDTGIDTCELFQKVGGIKTIMNGMTKVCITFNDMPQYVIKVPIQSNSELAIYREDYQGAFVELIGAVSDDGNVNKCWPERHTESWNYCAAETVYTRLADMARVGECVLGTYYLMDINTVPIYISPAAEAEMDIDDYSSKWYSNIEYNNLKGKTAEVLKERWCELDEDMGTYFVLSYGVDKFRKLVKFIADYQVTDLHDSNIMQGRDGKVKLIDMCGYNL